MAAALYQEIHFPLNLEELPFPQVTFERNSLDSHVCQCRRQPTARPSINPFSFTISLYVQSADVHNYMGSYNHANHYGLEKNYRTVVESVNFRVPASNFTRRARFLQAYM